MTTYASDLFDESLLLDMRERGYVKRTEHPVESFVIYNYTPKAQYENEWNDVTRACRGLIVDGDGTVIARPFPKFFNWDQMNAPRIPVGPARVGPKMDGSLGILYPTHDGGYAIATRGSFTSDQAIAGTNLYQHFASYCNFAPDPDKTYLFEIIYPENRIVVDYGDNSMLVLLDVIDIPSGKSDMAEFDACDWPNKVDWRMVPEFRHDLIETIPDGEEGLVFYWYNQDIRVKMKAAEYVRLHRIVTNTSTRTIWEHLSSGRPITELLEQVPDEFYQWVEKVSDDLWRQFHEIDVAISQEYFQISESIGWPDVGGLENVLSGADYRREYRKLFAAKAVKSEYRDVLFAQLDGKPWRPLVWKRLRPPYVKAFTNQTEDTN